VNHRFILNYLKDAYTQVRIHETSGKLVNEVQFPGIGSADGFGGRSNDKETFYSFTGYNTDDDLSLRHDHGQEHDL
jgi:Serine proteases of the peptidase family S9A